MLSECEFHVIVHPSASNNEYPDANARAQERWRLWRWKGDATEWFPMANHDASVPSPQEGAPLVLHDWDSLVDTSYLDSLPSDARIVIGGQITGVCVRIHVEYIAMHPRIKEFTIVFDRQALVGTDEGLGLLVEYLQERGITASIQE